MAKWFGTSNSGLVGHIIMATGFGVMIAGFILWVMEGMVF